jgi:hypothetical protein
MWLDLGKKIMDNYAYNIDNEITIATLCHIMQDEVESFISFFQRWRGLANRCPVDILEKQIFVMFVENLRSPLKHHLKVQCCTSFGDIVERGTILEKIHIEQGELKINNKTQNNQGITNDKNKY